jgi:hypothetical protein
MSPWIGLFQKKAWWCAKKHSMNRLRLIELAYQPQSILLHHLTEIAVVAKACLRSAIKSSASSIPVEMRNRSSVSP